MNSLSSVEIMDLKEGTWTQGPSLISPRANVGLVAIGEAIYAVGGFNGKAFLNSIECLDPSRKQPPKSFTKLETR